jgi:hypothetical protein
MARPCEAADFLAVSSLRSEKPANAELRLNNSVRQMVMDDFMCSDALILFE